MTPEISVVMPVWNTPAPFLAAAVASVLAQEGCRWEFVIVDDGSDPPIPPVLDPRVRWLRIGHRGGGAATNVGLAAARADLISRMDADDVMTPGRLAAQLAFLAAHAEVDCVGGQMFQCGPDLRVVTRTHYQQRPGPVAEQYIMAHSTVCYRKDRVLALGGYDERPWRGSDFRLWQAMDAAGMRFAVVEEVWVHRRIWPGSYSFSRSTYIRSLYDTWRETAAHPGAPAGDLQERSAALTKGAAW